MKKALYLLAICLALPLLLSACHTKQTEISLDKTLIINDEENYSPTTLIIMYDSVVGKKPLLKAINDYKAEIIYDYHFISGMAIKKPADKTLDEAITLFRRVEGVVSVERNRIIRLTDPIKPPLLRK